MKKIKNKKFKNQLMGNRKIRIIFGIALLVLFLFSSANARTIKVRKQSFFSGITDFFRNTISDIISTFKKGEVEVKRIEAPKSKYVSQQADITVILKNPEDYMDAESTVRVTTGQGCNIKRHILLEPKENTTLKLQCLVKNFNFKVKVRVDGRVDKVRTVSVKNPIEVKDVSGGGKITCKSERPRPSRGRVGVPEKPFSCEGKERMSMKVKNRMKNKGITLHIRAMIKLTKMALGGKPIIGSSYPRIPAQSSKNISFMREKSFKLMLGSYPPKKTYKRPIFADIFFKRTRLARARDGKVSIKFTYPKPKKKKPITCGNGICEKRKGETPKNCPKDCKRPKKRGWPFSILGWFR